MKKLLLSAIALVAFSSANAQLSESGKGKGYIRVAPKEFCYDGKVKLIMDESGYGETAGIFKIYDSNFEVEKTVTLNLGESKYKEIKQRRHYGAPVLIGYEDYKNYEYAETWEEAKGLFNMNEYTEKEGYQLWENTEDRYYKFETFGKTYPYSYYYWNPEDKYIYYRSNNYTDTYTGDWYNYDEDEGTRTIEPIYFEFNDYDNNRSVEIGFSISQTLFNNDEKYEALVPKFSQKEVISNEIDEDGDGVIDHRTMSVGRYTTGFSVVSEDGTELYSIETDFHLYLDALVKINGKLYIIADVNNSDDEDCIFFEINRETSNIKQVAKLKGMRVSPTIAEQTDNITVELGEGSNAKEIVVVNGNGQVVKQIPVKNGERQITINAGSLNRGLNILNARGAKGNNNCKIIVK
ncbi:MAG: hypothetical protein J6A02_00375 [Prevotella sp.]|nr:hypothetical protein [Prevotella sp.]